MSKRHSRRKRMKLRGAVRPVPTAPVQDVGQTYDRACSLVEQGLNNQARSAYSALASENLSPHWLALIENDLGALDGLAGELTGARTQFERALVLDPACDAARQNLARLDEDRQIVSTTPAISTPALTARTPPALRGPRVAIISLLFNWPSTGGGTVHTAEAGKFLQRAGYEIRHFYAQYAEWGVGNVTLPLDVPSEPLRFAPASWTAPEIQRRFREAVDHFAPDYVIITDSWNFKPLFAEAMQGYKYFLRLAALECLCPLNNVRLLVDRQGEFSACPRHQLATAEICRQCVTTHQHHSGSLHQAERALSGFGTPHYDEQLRRAFAQAEGVLAVNPLIATMVSPFAKAVHVVPSGFDPDRFPWPWPDEDEGRTKSNTTIFFAGIVDECMKGFRVLHAACAKLWHKRQDFELVATSDPVGQFDPMTRFVGWLPQDELPRHLRQADFLVFPTIAEEALGRSAVEAMGVGRPVIASRIGGLPFTVAEGSTGLLFEPGNVDDLAAKIATLLDDPALRDRMGQAGRRRFEEHFTWDTIIEKHYRPLLKPIAADQSVRLPGGAPSPPLRDVRGYRQLLAETAPFFGATLDDAERMFRTYRAMRDSQQMTRLSTNAAEISLEQGFVLCLLFSLTRPGTIVAVGHASDEVSRELAELQAVVGLESKVVHFDASIGVGAPLPPEETLPLPTADEPFQALPPPCTGSFRTDILDRYGSGFIWLGDASEHMAHEVLTETVGHFGQWSLAASQGNHRSAGSSTNAPLQRLADALGFSGPVSDQRTATHRLRTFDSAQELALLVASWMGGPVRIGPAQTAHAATT